MTARVAGYMAGIPKAGFIAQRPQFAHQLVGLLNAKPQAQDFTGFVPVAGW